MNSKTTFCVIGLGYIGLPTACIIANSGYRVFGIDTNKNVVESVNNAKPHIVEPGLLEILAKVKNKGLLSAHSEIQNADVYIITVPSPTTENQDGHHKPNIDFIIKAANAIGSVIKEENLVILESTSPIGTTEKIQEIIQCESKVNNSKLHFAYCPERVLPGNILHELIYNDRVVGGTTNKSSLLAKKTYQKFCKGKIHITTPRTAELTKLTENSYRDVNIAFANELSIICDKNNINPYELIELANKHPRVNILKPGCGVGGHCIAVDPWFIVANSKEETKIIQKAREVNIKKTEWVLKKIILEIEKLKLQLHRNPVIGCLGLSYKPDIDDLRESPALEISFEILKNKNKVLFCEPNIKEHNDFEISPIKKVLIDSDLIVILVAHKEFLNIDFKKYNYLDFTGITDKKYQK